MSKPEWSENYGVYRLTIGIMVIVVAWNPTRKDDPKGYKVSVVGAVSRSLKQLYDNPTQGKQAGLMLARKIVQEQTEILNLLEADDDE